MLYGIFSHGNFEVKFLLNIVKHKVYTSSYYHLSENLCFNQNYHPQKHAILNINITLCLNSSQLQSNNSFQWLLKHILDL